MRRRFDYQNKLNKNKLFWRLNVSHSLFSIFAIVILLLAIINTACISTLEPRMFNSRYTYEISIRHNGNLSDATFIIPIPVKNDSPKLGSEVYSNSDFGTGNANVLLTRSPVGLDKTNMSTLYGYDPWFLVINSQAPIPESSSIYNFRKDIHISLATPVFPINTMMPFGNETLIFPKYQFNGQNTPMFEKKVRSRISYSPTSIPYKTEIFADFDASRSTYVEISCYVEGRNYWIENYDESIGNGYRDQYSKIFFGETHGWYEAEGELRVAEGLYRPEWQLMMNPSI